MHFNSAAMKLAAIVFLVCCFKLALSARDSISEKETWDDAVEFEMQEFLEKARSNNVMLNEREIREMIALSKQ